MSDFNLRLAHADDLPAIVAIYNATVASRQVTADTEPVPVESRRPWFEAHDPATRPLWVLVAPDGRIAGWISFNSFYGRPAYGATAEVSLYVHEAFRRRGLGRRLLREALARAAGCGIDRLLGFIFGHNQPSLALFESEGFERWAHLPGVARLDGVERDLVIVGRKV